MIYTTTPRLLLRDWKEEDVPAFCTMNADPEVMRFFPGTLTEEETHGLHRVITEELATCGYGLYAAELKATNEFIGFIGFHRATFEAAFTPCVEIGWRLKPTAWGKGLATEGAIACLHDGFETLGFNEVYGFTAALNKPSIRVMEKAGMRPAGAFGHPKVAEGSPLRSHVLYRIERAPDR